MTVTLTPELDLLIRRKIESGRFRDATDVVSEALRQMDEQDRLEQLRAMIDEADAEIARGEFVEWTPGFMARLIREAEADERHGRPIPDHVKP